MEFPIITDSGANFHMFHYQEFFEPMTPFSDKVILGDGQTTLNIQGLGTVKLWIGDHLAESIYSLLLHIRTPNHG